MSSQLSELTLQKIASQLKTLSDSDLTDKVASMLREPKVFIISLILT
jgi:hypothetical protein